MPLDLLQGNVEGRNDAVEAVLTDHQTLRDQASQALHQAIEHMTKHSKRGPPAPFQTGDLVLVHRSAFRNYSTLDTTKKFDDRWFGPFPITKVINPNAYEIKLPPSFKQHRVINISFLFAYRQSERFPRPHPDSICPPVEPDDSSDVHDDDDPNVNQYEVESILKHRLSRRQQRKSSSRLSAEELLKLSRDPNDYEFLIKWKGYPTYESTWEPFRFLANAKDILKEYLNSKDFPSEWIDKLYNNE